MIKQEILDQLIGFAKHKISVGDIYRVNGFLSVEKDVKASFNLESDLAFDSFMIQAERAKHSVGIPLKCELQPNDFKTFKLISTNLITGKIEDESLRILGRKKIDDKDKYEFWAIWITNPNNGEFEQDKKVMVITRPLDLQSEDKNETEIKLKF